MNHSPTGPLGILKSGNVLTARPNAIVDRDGFDWRKGTFQWMRDGEPIPGADKQVYTLIDQDDGARITVRFSYTDDGGTDEVVISKPELIPDAEIEAVRTLYTYGLDREPDSEGLAFWSDYLDELVSSGQDRVLALADVMLAFTQNDNYAAELKVATRG
ncbi:hypothetical protein [Marivita sp.]|uniref:hypothetical protein n=1 Tax=Marivita sp. TaxID=2003365 RepID=UPI003F6EDF61